MTLLFRSGRIDTLIIYYPCYNVIPIPRLVLKDEKIFPVIVLFFFLCFHSCSPVIERIENYLNGIENAGFSGSVLVEWNGEKIISTGYGFRNQGKKLRNTSSTVFDVGSITKQFTVAAILKLERNRKLSDHDHISLYLTNLPADKSNITIHDLLRHQSGLQSNVGRDFDSITETDFTELVFNSPLLFETGTAFGYSNIGYSLLALSKNFRKSLVIDSDSPFANDMLVKFKKEQ